MLDAIIDVREYDVPYVMRAAIDNDIFVGLWYRCDRPLGSCSEWGRGREREGGNRTKTGGSASLRGRGREGGKERVAEMQKCR